MSKTDSESWLDANTMASEALQQAKITAAVQRAHNHLMLLVLATLARTAPPEAVDQLIDELERVRDMTGPAGNAAAEVFAAAVSQLERFARRS